jgi:hypothetical protein
MHICRFGMNCDSGTKVTRVMYLEVVTFLDMAAPVDQRVITRGGTFNSI